MLTEYRTNLDDPRERAEAVIIVHESSLKQLFNGPLASLDTWVEAKEEERPIILNGREFYIWKFTVTNILSDNGALPPIVLDRHFEAHLLGFGPQDIGIDIQTPKTKNPPPA